MPPRALQRNNKCILHATKLNCSIARMASPRRPLINSLFWQTILCLLLHSVNVNAQSCLPNEQPIVNSLDPPSGTTGTDESLSTVYTITGERLDQVSSIIVELQDTRRRLEVVSMTTEERTISFRLFQARIGVGSIATVTIVPNNTNCSDVERAITLYDTIVLILRAPLEAQPGTTITTLSQLGTCLPNECGNNNTMYEVIVGEITLELFEIGTSSFVARFPEFSAATDSARVTISTQYQDFRLSTEFELFLQTNDSAVTPSQGQRGTRVIITGTNLLGHGSDVSLSSVTIGGMVADIISSSMSTIELRAASGTPGTASISINTTQNFGGSVYDGPYTLLDNFWTQLEDGMISDIIPPGAQVGSTVTLCGTRLLGGGRTISEVSFLQVVSSNFSMIPFASRSPLPGIECITAEVPPITSNLVTGSVEIVSDTGAIVQSLDNFTLAEIEEVIPSRGQPGTIVTIRGAALLSGYSVQPDFVTLNGISAETLSSNETEVRVRAAEPSNDTQIGQPGDVVITVGGPFGSNHSISSAIQTWTYELPGQIETVSPMSGQAGTLLTVTGTNLFGYGNSIDRATIGGLDAVLVGTTNTMVTLRAPDGNPGIADIVLVSENGAEVTGNNAFEFLPRGTISEITPIEGQSGTFVSISGENLFGYGSNVTSVEFGSIPAIVDYSQSNSTLIMVRIRPNVNITENTPILVTITSNTLSIVESALGAWTYLVHGMVTDIQPPIGQDGTRVTITGTNLLGGGRTAVEVLIDGVETLILNSLDTSIEVVMRDLATRSMTAIPQQAFIMSDTGAIVQGGNYTHQISGTIENFSPTIGREGTTVLITGRNLLGYGDNIQTVTVAGVEAQIISFNDSELTIEVGEGVENAEGPILLIINTGAVIRSLTNFTYEQPGSVASISPSEGAEGIGVLIRGLALFPTNADLASVTIGGNPVSRIVTSTRTEISVIVGPAPPVDPMMSEVLITASDGSFVNGGFFSFLELEISLPGLTSGREGTQIEIILPNSPQFSDVAELRSTIDDEYAEIVSSTATTIIVTVPRAKQVGMFTADVTIENAQRLVARLQNGFTYLPEGLIFSIEPNFGQRGTRVVLRGENLLGGGANIEFASLAEIPANVMRSSDEVVEVVIMANPAEATAFPITGSILLRANTGAIALRLDAFTLVQPGAILSITPNVGQAGTQVTINGTDLLQGNESEIQQVTIAGSVAMLLEGTASDNQIIVVAAPSNPQTGPIEIVLTTGALITSSLQFEYLQQGTITMLDPNFGTAGTRVIIRGTNLLGGGTSIQQVRLGGVDAVVESFTNDNITVIAQPSEPDLGFHVEIIADTGAMIIENFGWTYRSLGSISNVDPPVGQQGLEVALSGTQLLGQSGRAVEECTLTGIPGRVVSFTRSRVICRAGFYPDLINMPANGTGPVEILTDLGVTISSETNITFTYYVAQIDTVNPSIGNNGTIVQISGMNLIDFPGGNSTLESVWFGNTSATVILSSNNDIIVRVGQSNSTEVETVRITSSSGSFVELDNAWRYSQPGRIDRIIPNVGFPGDIVLIEGANLFPPMASMNEVVVIVGQTMSSRAQIINSSYVEFVAGVYQSSDNAEEALPVQIIYSTGETVYSPEVRFTYNATPSFIESVFPVAGAANTVVTITGRNLTRNQNITQVYLAGVAVDRILENATDEEIIVVAGIGPSRGIIGTIVVETSDGQQFGLAGTAWRYYPTLTSSAVSPSSGQNGTIVTITLPGGDAYPMIENVTLADYPVAMFSYDMGTLTVTAETNNLTNFSVVGNAVITFIDATQLTIPNAWMYLEPIEINSLEPVNMLGYFNAIVTISGRNFQAAGLVTVTDVYLAGVQTDIVSQTDMDIQVQITEDRNSTLEPFVGPVVIVSENGATYTSPFDFTYVQVRVDSVEPQQGQRGTRVNITGSGLLLGGSTVDFIQLEDTEAMILNATNYEIIASAGEDFSMQFNLSDIVYRVDTEAELTIPDSWRYIASGEILSVSPDEGGMGTVVTIMGTNLFGGGESAETVLLNNVPAQSIVTNFNNFIQVVAGQTATALSPGSVQVVSNTGAITESSSNIAFEFLTPGMITNALPQEGQNGTRIRIDGSHLHNGEGVNRILLAGIDATIESTIEDPFSEGFPTTFEVRAGRPSTPHSFSGPITIISHFNTMSISNFNFTYLSEGVIFGVTPSDGQTGTQVTLSGENLLGGGSSIQTVFLAGIEANVTGIPTDNMVQVIANPFPQVNFGDVVLISDTGAYVRRVDGWIYVEEGVVNDIQPQEGQWGTLITITGQRLLSGGSTVTSGFLNDVPLTITESSETRVVAEVGQPTSGAAFNSSTITLIGNLGGRLVQEISWMFLNQSSIETVSPSSGFGNMIVTITGTNLLGGGTRISQASLASIPAMLNSITSNDTIVRFRSGFNFNGLQLQGNVYLESDTGAITEAVNSWVYNNECPAGQYGMLSNCQPCDSECSTCDGPESTDCFTCQNFALELTNSTDNVECVPSCANVSTLGELRFCRDACESNEYARVGIEGNVSGIFCYPCNDQCNPDLGCSGPNATECGGCAEVLNVLNGTCITECPIGTYEDELRRCLPCNSQCVVEDGCTGPNSTDCNSCSNVFVSVTLSDGVFRDSCLDNCPRLYLQQSESDLCAPCNEQCLEGCRGLSPFDCVSCKGASFMFPNGTRRCASTCNADPTRLAFYEDSDRVCQPCSTTCSLTDGCFGPTAFDCNSCKLVANSNVSIPQLNGECLNVCPNVNRTYTFYADNNTNQCEPCHIDCPSIGCTGPLITDCFDTVNPLAAEGGAIALFIVFLILLIIALGVLVAYILYQRKRQYSYKIHEGDDTIELGYRDTPMTQSLPNEETNDVSAAKATDSSKDPETLLNEAASPDSLKKSEGDELGSQDLLYTDMQPEPRYATPTPKSERKPIEAEAPPRPAPYKKAADETPGKGSKPPPPRPPSPTPELDGDGELYTDMEASVQEIHVNPGAVAEEEYSEMAPGHIVHPNVHPIEVGIYDEATLVPPSSDVSNPPTTQDDQQPLIDDNLYEDTEAAVAQAEAYKRVSRDEPIRDSKRLSTLSEKPPELPSRPAPKKRHSTPLPETPLQKSLSNTSFSPSHEKPAPIADDIYIEPMGGPIEECLYEELPTTDPTGAVAESEYNEIRLPPRPKN